MNTTVGQSLTEELRNDHLLLGPSKTHTILGTRWDIENAQVPSGVNKLVKKQKIRHWKKYLMASDVIIFDLLTSSTDEVANALHVLKTQDYETEKILILISSVITWVNTLPNRRPSKISEDNTDADSDNENNLNIENSGIDETGEMVYPFEESDFARRNPSPRYQGLKTIENQALAAMKSKQNLKVYILCAGVLYGNGENHFYSHFKQAWMGKTLSLPVIGSGDNIIPTIYGKDKIIN